MVNRIPLIEIKNSILLKFASEADRYGNKNSLIDTPEELSIFQKNAADAIEIGLCTKKDYDDVMQIDTRNIKTQVTTMEDLRNAKLKNSPNGKDYNEKYYIEMKEKFRTEIDKYEKEIIKIQKELCLTKTECESIEKTNKIKTKEKLKEITLETIFLGGAIVGLFTYTYPLALFSSMEFGLHYALRDEEVFSTTDDEKIMKNKFNNLKNMIQDMQNMIDKAKSNFDTIVKQDDFLKNMENYVKILDQRDSYLNKLDILN